MNGKPLLDQCSNMFGEPLPKEIRKRIRLFLTLSQSRHLG